MRKPGLAALTLLLILALAGMAWGAAVLVPGAVTKNAASVVDYGIPWSDWLNGDTISTSTWTYATGLTGANPSLNQTAVTINGKACPPLTVALTWLSGGTAGQSYTVTNKITTAGGRTEIVSFKVTVK